MKHQLITSILRVEDQHTRDYSYLRSVLNKEYLSAGSWYKAAIDYILGDILLREGKPAEAIEVFNSKLNTYKNTSMEVDMLVRIAQIYGDYLNDKVRAKEYADRAAEANPGQDNVRFAYNAVGVDYNPYQYADKFGPDTITRPLTKDEQTQTGNSITISPNPANPVTTISYSIRDASHVKLSIFAVNGQKVATLVDGFMTAGSHAAVFDGSALASGVYFYRLETKGFAKTGKMMLVK